MEWTSSWYIFSQNIFVNGLDKGTECTLSKFEYDENWVEQLTAVLPILQKDLNLRSGLRRTQEMNHFIVNLWKEPHLWSLKESVEDPVSPGWLGEGGSAYFRLLCLKLHLQNVHILKQPVCRALAHKINLTERIFSIIWQPVLKKWNTELKWHVSSLLLLFQSWVTLPGACPTSVLTACQEAPWK